MLSRLSGPGVVAPAAVAEWLEHSTRHEPPDGLVAERIRGTRRRRSRALRHAM